MGGEGGGAGDGHRSCGHEAGGGEDKRVERQNLKSSKRTNKAFYKCILTNFY